MNRASAPVGRSLRRLAKLSALVAALWASVALADDYGDVNQMLRAGKYTEAMTKADLFLQGKPKDPQMRFLKGVIQTESGRGQEAVSTFLKLTEDYPELPEPYNNLAVLYAGQGQYDKARAALEMAIRTNPSYTTAHENLGDVYAKLASQAYSKALQLDSSNTGVQPKLALIRDLFSKGAKSVPGSSAPTIVAKLPATTTPPVAAATPAATPATTTPAAAPATTTAAAPAAASPAAAPAGSKPAAPAVNETAAVESAVRNWATAWAAKDMGSYLGAYGEGFRPAGGQSRAAWESDRRARIVGKSRISVNLSELTVSVNGDKATARFRQQYAADSLNITSRKQLDLVKSAGRWVIVRESTG